MYLTRPYSLMASSADPDVLAALAHAPEPLSGREVARRAGRSQDRTRHVLERLVGHGIVLCQDTGSARLYSLNRDHLAAPAIAELADLRALLVDRLRQELAAWEVAPAAAALFGSAARGDGGLNSDIDLLLVRPADVDEEQPTWRSQIDRLAERVRAWTGNGAGIVEIAAGDVADLIDRAPPILDSIRSEGVDLAGTRIVRLLGSGR
jgi:predicted nucleotidyltransferase